MYSVCVDSATAGLVGAVKVSGPAANAVGGVRLLQVEVGLPSASTVHTLRAMSSACASSETIWTVSSVYPGEEVAGGE